MALTCRIPLREFLERIEKFERSMGAFAMAAAKSAEAFGRKSQWAVFMSEEVAKLRTSVGAKVLSINLLLATHTSESISRVEAQSHKSHATLLASILEIRSRAACATKAILTTETVVRSMARDQKRHHGNMKKALDNSNSELRTVSDATTAATTAIMSFRDLGAQLLQSIRALPQQVRVSLEQVVRSNLEMYTMLRDIQTSLLRSPGNSSANTFLFEDVLGRQKSLPYEYFRHINVFNAFLGTEFRGLPGERYVLEKQYAILDVRRGEKAIGEDEWALNVFPGAILAMSALVEPTYAQMNDATHCPRPNCHGKGRAQDQRLSLTW